MKLANKVFEHISEPLSFVEQQLQDVLSEGAGPAVEMTLHLQKSGGKRVRPAMAILAAMATGGDTKAVVPVGVAAEMIHMATLVHDDVIDEAEMRRGLNTANRVWGNSPAVLTGDRLLARALVLLVDESPLEVVRVMARMLDQMCEGEIIQMVDGADVHQGEDDYFNRIEKKTALFFEACCRSGALVSGAPPAHVEALAAYGLNLGMAFQVVDDLLDVSAEAEAVGKPVGNDLASGVFTLPVLHLLGREGYRERLLPLLADGAPDPKGVQAVLSIVRENGATEYAYGVAERFVETALENLTVLPESETRTLLEAVGDFVLERGF